MSNGAVKAGLETSSSLRLLAQHFDIGASLGTASFVLPRMLLNTVSKWTAPVQTSQVSMSTGFCFEGIEDPKLDDGQQL